MEGVGRALDVHGRQDDTRAGRRSKVRHQGLDVTLRRVRQGRELGENGGHRGRQADYPRLAGRHLPEQLPPAPINTRRDQIHLAQVRREPREQVFPEHGLAQSPDGVASRLIRLVRLHVHQLGVEREQAAQVIGIGRWRGAGRAPEARHALADRAGMPAVRAQVPGRAGRELLVEQEGMLGRRRLRRQLDHRGQAGDGSVRLLDDGAKRSKQLHPGTPALADSSGPVSGPAADPRRGDRPEPEQQPCRGSALDRTSGMARNVLIRLTFHDSIPPVVTRSRHGSAARPRRSCRSAVSLDRQLIVDPLRAVHASRELERPLMHDRIDRMVDRLDLLDGRRAAFPPASRRASLLNNYKKRA